MHWQLYSMWYAGLMIDTLAYCAGKIEDERFSFTEVTGERLTYSRELMSPNKHKNFTRNYLSLELCDSLKSQFTINSNRKKRQGTKNVLDFDFQLEKINSFILVKEKKNLFYFSFSYLGLA